MNQKMKLLPLPIGAEILGSHIVSMTLSDLEAYARANAEHCTENLRAEIEALKQDLDQYLDAALKEHEHAERLQDLCAAAYQMAGVHDAPVEWLDALSNAANGKPFSTVGLLPHIPKSVCDAEARAERLEEALRHMVSEAIDGGHNYMLKAIKDSGASALLRDQGESQ